MSRIELYIGDTLETLKGFKPETFQAVITSLPYWGLRDYGVAGAYGMELTFEAWAINQLAVFTEIYRVLRPDGVLWLNIGDKYDSCGSLMFQPELFAFDLMKAGWVARQRIIWYKPDAQPEAAQNRPMSAYDNIFMFTKTQSGYYYDRESVREENSPRTVKRAVKGNCSMVKVRTDTKHSKGVDFVKPFWTGNYVPNPLGRYLRNVWMFPTGKFAGGHYASFPLVLPELCIMLSTSGKGACPECGRPWKRVLERKYDFSSDPNKDCGYMETVGWVPDCEHQAEPVPCKVLDPYSGTGTTLEAAARNLRDGTGIDIDPRAAGWTQKRLSEYILFTDYVIYE